MMMLIRSKTVGSDGAILTNDIFDLDLFLRDNADGLAKDRADEIRRTLRRRDGVYRIDIMAGMYCDVSKATLADAKAYCRTFGYSLSYKPEYKEYRVAPLAGTPRQREDRACYTDDIADAIGTARFEAQRTKEMAVRAIAALTGNDNHDEANCPGGADCPYRCPPRR